MQTAQQNELEAMTDMFNKCGFLTYCSPGALSHCMSGPILILTG